MDQLVNLIVEKTGISEAQARQAVDIVLKFLKERLPDPIANRLEDLIEGAEGFDLTKGLDLLGGLFGNK